MSAKWSVGSAYRDCSGDESGVIEAIRGYDWCCAFTAAANAGIDRDAVASVVAMVEGENDAADWVGVFHLKDGRFLYVSGGCDYTGWDCQSSAVADVRDTLEAVIVELCTDDDRERLQLPLPSSAKPSEKGPSDE